MEPDCSERHRITMPQSAQQLIERIKHSDVWVEPQ